MQTILPLPPPPFPPPPGDPAAGDQPDGSGFDGAGSSLPPPVTKSGALGVGAVTTGPKTWSTPPGAISPEYQKGYHKIFLPLVNYAKQKGFTNKIVKKVLEHIAVHRTIDIRQEARGKRHMLGRIYRKVLEPICYWVGRYGKRT